MIAAVLALAASLVWGTSDFAAGYMGRRTTVWGVVLLTQLAGLTATGAVVLALGHPFPPPAGWVPGMLAGLSGLVAVVSFYTALSIGVMSLVASISSTGIMVPVLVGLARGERPSVIQYAGMALAVGGVVLASREPPRDTIAGPPDDDGFVATGPAGPLVAPSHGLPHEERPAAADPAPSPSGRGLEAPPGSGASAALDAAAAAGRPSGLRAAVFRPRPATTLSFVLALVAAVAIGASYVGMDAAADYDSYWGVFLMRATSSPLVLLTFLIVRPTLGVSPRHVLPILLVGIGDTTANTLFAVASTYGYLSVVSVLGYLYPVVTVLLAHVVLHERLAPLQKAAAGAALAGAIMVAA
ncbi:MAG: DMT family transporter [Actinobacteria bacterium]|nr:DMT family transporter [Actinomycetota bacterium]